MVCVTLLGARRIMEQSPERIIFGNRSEKIKPPRTYIFLTFFEIRNNHTIIPCYNLGTKLCMFFNSNCVVKITVTRLLVLIISYGMLNSNKCSSGFKGTGGGGGADAFFSGIRAPADPKGLLCTILRYPFWLTDLKNFPKAPLAPIYFRERAPKKRNFLVKIFQKVPRNAFLACFLKNLPAVQKKWSKWGSNLRESSENQFGRPK